MIHVTTSVYLSLAHEHARERDFISWLAAHPLPAEVPNPRKVLPVYGHPLGPTGHAQGCAASHANALYRFHGEQSGGPDDWCLVFEDDARWGPEFARAWPEAAAAVPADAEVFMVGGAAMAADSRGERLGERLTRIRGVYRLHCYAVRRSAAAKVARIFESELGQHCDILLARASERGEVSVVAAMPFLVAQCPRPGHWYAWNDGDRGVGGAGLEVYAEHVLGVPAERRPPILWGSDATPARARQLAGSGARVLAVAEGEIAVLGPAPSAPPPASKSAPSEACPHAAPLLGFEKRRLGLDVRKDWRRCGHPQQPLGEYVCPCKGCGPGCSGYPTAAGPST